MKKYYSKPNICFLLISLVLVNFFVITIYKINENNFYLKIAQIIGTNKAFENELLTSLKNKSKRAEKDGKKILQKHGYTNELFIFKNKISFVILLCTSSSVLTFLLFILYGFYQNKKLKVRINAILSLAENIQQGNYKFIKETEDEFSSLEDEIYKTLILLRETRLNALNEKEEYKENLENIAHQLKIPITSINLMLELLEDNKTDKNILKSEKFCKIKKQVNRLENLTEILLKLARLDSGSIKMNKSVFLLEECLIHSIEIIEDDLKAKKLMPVVNVNETKIYGDFYWLSEAFLNIIKNFSDLYPQIQNIFITAKDNSIYSEISFENDGPKILENELKNIFRRFYKSSLNTAEAKKTENDENKGFGIGLAMTKAILKNHNAEIRVENKKSTVAFIIKFYKK